LSKVTQEDVDCIRDLTLKIHALTGEIDPATDALFALATEMGWIICTKYPATQWHQVVGAQLKLLIQCVNEFPHAP